MYFFDDGSIQGHFVCIPLIFFFRQGYMGDLWSDLKGINLKMMLHWATNIR